MLAGLPYVVWPIGSFFILASRKKEDPFLCYHAWQALLSGALMATTLLVVTVFMFLGFRVLPGSASYAPAVISLGTLSVGAVVIVSVFLTALFLGWRATEGEMLRLPFLGDFSEQKMLDECGMTRRQFQEMCDAAFKIAATEEEIPFPEMQPDPPIQASRSTNRLSDTSTSSRLEAARQARAAAQQQPQVEPFLAPAPQDPTPQVSRPTPQVSRPTPQPRGPAGPGAQRRPQMPPQAPQPNRPSQPVVKEVDLISHYKEKQVPREGQRHDVLKQWLSSVDQDN